MNTNLIRIYIIKFKIKCYLDFRRGLHKIDSPSKQNQKKSSQGVTINLTNHPIPEPT